MRTLPRNVSMMTGFALTLFGIVLSHEAPAASPVLQAALEKRGQTHGVHP
jgi:hypothetical protein